MDAKYPCPECEAELGFSGAKACKKCGWEARKPVEHKTSKYAGHDSNPNDPVCKNCGGTASIFPNVFRGGGKGFCGECFRRLRGAATEVTVEGHSFAQDINDFLHSTRSKIEEQMRKR